MRFIVTCVLLLATFAATAVEPYGRIAKSSDGTGIVYMGRETAGIMGHEGADWLERPDRLDEERPDLLRRRWRSHPGCGWPTSEPAPASTAGASRSGVAPAGRVYAVDVQPEMLARLDAEMKTHRVTNVVSVLGSDIDPRLPRASIDLALMVDVYHEFDHPREMLAAIVGALKPGGRVVFVEYRQEDPKVGILPHHKMSEAQVRREAAAAGLVWQKTIETLPTQHIVEFAKPR